MAESIQNRSGDVSNPPEKRSIGRVFLDAIAQGILNLALFVFGFLGWCVRWSFATILLLGVMAVSAWFVFNQAVKGGGFVVVPDVTGWPVMQAANRLAEEGLEVGDQKPVMSESMPAYHVLVQRPAPGKVIRKGREISLTISSGKQDQPSPNLIGKTFEDAERDLQSTPFQLGTVARVSNELARDTILAQDPRPQKAAEIGSEIHLLVSDGPAETDRIMPALEGLFITQAMDQLAPLDVNVVPINVDREGAPYDEVLEQSPEPFVPLVEGERVTLKVRLSRVATLPNLHHMVDVTYTVPNTSFSPAVRVVLQDRDRNRRVVFPQPKDYVNGEEPRLPPGTRITIPEVTFADEAQIEFYADGVLHQRYTYSGSGEPVRRTINEPNRPTPAVSSTPLPPDSPQSAAETQPAPAAPQVRPRPEPIEIEVFEPRTERVGPSPR